MATFITDDVSMPNNFFTLTELPTPRLTPWLPILAQGEAAALSDLIVAKAVLLPALEHNKLVRSQIDGQLMLLYGIDPSIIRNPDNTIPARDAVDNYMAQARSRLHNVHELLSNQLRIINTFETLIRQKSSETTPSDDNETFVKVPDTVTRFGKSDSRNAKEFLRTFITQIEASSPTFDPEDGVTLGRYLSQVIEDISMKNSFSQAFVTAVKAKKPNVLCVAEVSTIFIKHCGKTPDDIETSDSLAPWQGEPYTDYGASAHGPAITNYLE
ncbi:hypothetical protein BGZ65_002298, partial [Modicella reniformis]